MDFPKDQMYQNHPPAYDALFNDPLTTTSSDQRSSASVDLFASHRRAQEERIHRLVSLYIDPLLQNHASSGIAKAIFVLVPSDAKALQSENSSQEDVIDKTGYPGSQESNDSSERLTSFADDDNVRLVRLHGDNNNWAFWRQASVVKDLESEIRSRYDLRRPTPIVEEQPSTIAPTGKRGGFFRKKPSNKAPPVKSPTGGMFSSGGGWSTSVQDAKPGWGEVVLDIRVEQVSLRTVTKMGLFDTRSGPALVLRIHIGSS